jgi:hypothetical protein
MQEPHLNQEHTFLSQSHVQASCARWEKSPSSVHSVVAVEYGCPEVIEELAQEQSIDLTGTMMFYYEVYEKELDDAKTTMVSG